MLFDRRLRASGLEPGPFARGFSRSDKSLAAGRRSSGRFDDITGGLYVADDSRNADVGARYAQALFELAVDGGAVDAVETDLKGFRGLLAESADLRRLLTSPTFSPHQKVKALEAVAAKARFHPLTRKFLGLLAANARASALPTVTLAYQRLASDRRGVVPAEVVTAVTLTPAQEKGVVAALRQALGKEPEITARVDPTILGGLKVRVGSRLFDASLKSRLDHLKFALKRA
jgi:F-type H+-transporting ATPase subunit delta